MNKTTHSKIRTGFLLVILISATVSGILFAIFWNLMPHVWNLARQHPPFSWRSEEFFEKIREEALHYDLPGSADDTEAVEALEPLFESCDDYTSIGFYGKEDGLYRAGCEADILLKLQYGPLFTKLFDLATRRQNNLYPVSFRNAEAEMYLLDYHTVYFIYPYIIASAILCVAIFLLIVLHYINSRIRDILTISREITRMASGDLMHPIPPAGKDEIGILAEELDRLRAALAGHIRQEEEIRKSNQDLITSISHDLRTPLTILNGYLEVLNLDARRDGPKPSADSGNTIERQTKDQHERRTDYLQRCLRKTADIRELTDRMFEYALVYEVEESPDFSALPVCSVCECLLDHLEFIRLAGFTTNEPRFPENGFLYGDEAMLKRVLNNLFSNILKYGDKRTPVALDVTVSDGRLAIRLSNSIKKERSGIASNQIGLKSVKKIAELHNGSFLCKNESGSFQAELMLPLSGPD